MTARSRVGPGRGVGSAPTPHPDEGRSRHAAILELQRAVGNRRAIQLLRPAEARPGASAGASPSTIGQLRDLRARAPQALLAGTAVERPAPDGVAQNAAVGNAPGGVPAGLTQYAQPGEFGLPSIDVATERTEQGVTGTLQSTTARDGTHTAHYAGAGEHTYTDRSGIEHTVLVESDLSDDLRCGEEEHLADARRAFDLTLGRVATTVNALAGRRFGPASTDHAVLEEAEAAVGRHIRPLEPHPGDWIRRLIELMRRSRQRDTRGWHSVVPRAAYDRPDLHQRGVELLVRGGAFSVDEHPSSEVVVHDDGDRPG